MGAKKGKDARKPEKGKEKGRTKSAEGTQTRPSGDQAEANQEEPEVTKPTTPEAVLDEAAILPVVPQAGPAALALVEILLLEVTQAVHSALSVRITSGPKPLTPVPLADGILSTLVSIQKIYSVEL